MCRRFIIGISCLLIGLYIGLDILIVDKTPSLEFSLMGWFGNFINLSIAILTGFLARIAWVTSESWKSQKQPECKMLLLRSIRNYQMKIENEYEKIKENLSASSNDYKEIYKIHKDFGNNIGKFLIEIELNITEFLIFNPEYSDFLLRKERQLKKIYCIFYYIYEEENRNKISTFKVKAKKNILNIVG